MKRNILISWLICLLPLCSIHAQASHWQCDIRSYQYDMTVYACLSINGIVLDASADYEIAAFYGGECRGVASVETIESTGKTYYYLRVRSNTSNGETITLKCYDKGKQCELVLDNTVYFESQGIEGYPSNPFVLTGAYAYKVNYVVEGEVIASDSVKCGMPITLPEGPTKEGYTFSGWSEVPETMPAEDITVSGTFTINKYLVTFKIGDEVITSDSLEYGAVIIAPDAPEKEGHTFDGWGEVEETVPANDVTFEGIYTVNIYTIYYYVDNELVHTAEVAYGEAIPEYIYEPTKEGDVFEGWIGENYETMPAHNVTYTANIESGIEDTEIIQNSELIYDLLGRKVTNTKNLRNGIYIINNRKVMIK